MLTSPDSLCARVLKGKYYHDHEFMSAKNKRGSSHIWRAILHGREGLKLGLIKRVGDGSSIHPWEDPWIPFNHGFKPLIQLPDAAISRVEELIDADNGEWNMNLINANFVEPDVSVICRIPISNSAEDIWAWQPEKHGHFTVKSAYRVLVSKSRQTYQPGSSINQEKVWKKMWKLEVPPKVKNFWWRIIHDFIPCRAVLKRRHMERIDFCDTCGQQETTMHAIFDCTWARIFWEQVKSLTGIKIPDLHPHSWMFDVVDGTKIPQSEACIILSGAWAIWTERNARKHGESGRCIMQSVRWVIDSVMDSTSAGKVSKPKQSKQIKWNPPDEGVMKINVDASFDDVSCQGSTGLVIRDREGALLHAQTLWYNFAASSQSMEAEAIRDGVRMAIERGFSKVEVETDAQAIVKLWESDTFDRSEIAAILQEIRELSDQFESFRLKFVRREANEAAHLCAKQATSVRRRCLWLNYTPVFLMNTLYRDCMPA